ncbi:MAG TPA: membrane protein [Bacillota bacterium]
MFAYGIDLQRVAGLGLMAWSVLHEGIARQTVLTFGQANIAVGIVLLAGSYALGIRPRLGTLVSMVLIGLFTDAILAWNLIPGAAGQDMAAGAAAPARDAATAASAGASGGASWLRAYGYLILGITVMGLGTGWYISADLGAGPRDSLMLGLVRRTGWQVGTVRSAMEASALLVGWLLGGSVGVGTVIGTLSIGWLIQAALHLFRHLSRRPALSLFVRPPAWPRQEIRRAHSNV